MFSSHTAEAVDTATGGSSHHQEHEAPRNADDVQQDNDEHRQRRSSARSPPIEQNSGDRRHSSQLPWQPSDAEAFAASTSGEQHLQRQRSHRRQSSTSSVDGSAPSVTSADAHDLAAAYTDSAPANDTNTTDANSWGQFSSVSAWNNYIAACNLHHNDTNVDHNAVPRIRLLRQQRKEQYAPWLREGHVTAGVPKQHDKIKREYSTGDIVVRVDNSTPQGFIQLELTPNRSEPARLEQSSQLQRQPSLRRTESIRRQFSTPGNFLTDEKGRPRSIKRQTSADEDAAGTKKARNDQDALYQTDRFLYFQSRDKFACFTSDQLVAVNRATGEEYKFTPRVRRGLLAQLRGQVISDDDVLQSNEAWLSFKPWRMSWWQSVMLMLGSLLLLISSASQFFPTVQNDTHLSLAYSTYPSLGARLCYLIAGSLQLYAIMIIPTTLPIDDDEEDDNQGRSIVRQLSDHGRDKAPQQPARQKQLSNEHRAKAAMNPQHSAEHKIGNTEQQYRHSDEHSINEVQLYTDTKQHAATLNLRGGDVAAAETEQNTPDSGYRSIDYRVIDMARSSSGEEYDAGELVSSKTSANAPASSATIFTAAASNQQNPHSFADNRPDRSRPTDEAADERHERQHDMEAMKKHRKITHKHKHRSHHYPYNNTEHDCKHEPAVIVPSLPDVPLPIVATARHSSAYRHEHWPLRIALKLCQWNRIDFNLAVWQWCGSVMFTVGVVSSAGDWPSLHIRDTHMALITIPSVVGSICFSVSGYLGVVEATHQWLSFEPMRMDWWLTWSFTLGSLGYLVSAVLYIFYGETIAYAAPLLAGSILYFGASALMYLEQSDAVPAEFV